MNRRIAGLVSLVVVLVGTIAGLIGFALGVEMASSIWRTQLPELGKVVAYENAGVRLQAQEWPDDIRVVVVKTEGELLTVYMGVAGDTEVDLAFEKGRLVSIQARRQRLQRAPSWHRKRPYSELTRQPDRGILRAMVAAGSGAAKTGPSKPGNKRTARETSTAPSAAGQFSEHSSRVVCGPSTTLRPELAENRLADDSKLSPSCLE